MLQQLMNRYKTWDAAVMADLQSMSEGHQPAGSPSFLQKSLKKLTRIELLQLYHFCQKWRGKRLMIRLAQMSGLFLLLGICLYLYKQKGSIASALVIGQVLGWSVSFAAFSIWFNYRQLVTKPFRVLAMGVVGMTAGVLTAKTGFALAKGQPVLQALQENWAELTQLCLGIGAVYALLLGGIAVVRNQSYEMMNAQLSFDAERERHARQQTETELRLLRAQIEPHFLFNTLGAVQQLALRDGQRAAELTGNLITFLRASLSEIRAEQVTLQEECELIRAYLHVMQVRMGARLQFAIDLPVRFQAVRIPSMLILTMVENAIKHGIEPSVNPGQIQIRIASDAGNIRILTEDNGVGLSEVQTGGTGLQNSRERLQLMFGNAAELAIYERAEGGVCAAVTIPDTTKTGQST